MNDLVDRQRRLVGVLTLSALAALITACATTKTTTLNAEWKDPQMAAQTAKGGKLLVVCEAGEAAVKRICQDRMASELEARGGSAEIAAEMAPPAAGAAGLSEQYRSAAQVVGARAVLSSTLAPAYDNSGGDSGVSIGFGLGSFGRGSFGGVGVSAPIGGSAAPRASSYIVDNRITDTSTGRLIWTAKATIPADGDVSARMSDLARTVLEAAQKAGVL